MKEAIFFCMVGLPLFGKEGSGTPVFKILVRALGGGGGRRGSVHLSGSAHDLSPFYGLA